MSRKFNNVNTEKLIDNAKKLYSNIAISFYNDAFFALGLKRIKRELKQIVNT